MVGFQRGGPVQVTMARKKQNKKSGKMMPEEGEVKPQRDFRTVWSGDALAHSSTL